MYLSGSDMDNSSPVPLQLICTTWISHEHKHFIWTVPIPVLWDAIIHGGFESYYSFKAVDSSGDNGSSVEWGRLCLSLLCLWGGAGIWGLEPLFYNPFSQGMSPRLLFSETNSAWEDMAVCNTYTVIGIHSRAALITYVLLPTHTWISPSCLFQISNCTGSKTTSSRFQFLIFMVANVTVKIAIHTSRRRNRWYIYLF